MKRFSKTICLALLVVAMTFVLAGCKSPKQDVGDIVITAPETEAPAVVEEPAPVEEPKEEAPAVVEEPAPVVEEPASVVEEPAPVVEEPKAEEVVVAYKPVAKKYTFAGYELSVIADKGRAVIQYPSIIAKADIDAAAQAAVAAFGSVYDLSGVSYSVNEMDHVLTVYYPEAWGMDELSVAEQLVMQELPGYAAAVYAALMQPAEEEVVAEAPAAEETPALVVDEDAITLNFSVFGYEASIRIEEYKATFKYPSFITDDEIWAAAKLAYAVFGSYLQGTSLEIVAPGEAVLTYTEDYSDAELEYAASILEDAIPEYVASVVASLEVTAEPVEEEVEEPSVSLFERDFNLFGYEATILASGDKVAFVYPDFVTNAEVKAAAEAAYAVYSNYLQGSSLTIDNGVAVLKLAYSLDEADFNYAADLLEKELGAYVQTLFAQAPAKEEPVEAEEVAVVAEAPAVEEAPVETPAVEEPAPVVEEPAKTEEPAKQPEQPKQEETKTEAPAAQPAATPAAQPAPAKKSNVGLIILIIVLVLVAAAAVVVVLKKKKN